MKIEDRVLAGTKWLDENVDNWWNIVYLPTLNLESNCRCVLGQVFRTEAENVNDERYGKGFTGFDYVDTYMLSGNEVVDYGFDAGPGEEYEDLQTEWERVIKERKVLA